MGGGRADSRALERIDTGCQSTKQVRDREAFCVCIASCVCVAAAAASCLYTWSVSSRAQVTALALGHTGLQPCFLTRVSREQGSDPVFFSNSAAASGCFSTWAKPKCGSANVSTAALTVTAREMGDLRLCASRYVIEAGT